jgi:hypothetical protein
MKGFKLYRWFSICSAHPWYDKECQQCQVGSWYFMPFYYVGRFFYWLSPGLWRLWANRGNVKARFKNQFTDRDGNKKDVFPNL